MTDHENEHGHEPDRDRDPDRHREPGSDPGRGTDRDRNSPPPRPGSGRADREAGSSATHDRPRDARSHPAGAEPQPPQQPTSRGGAAGRTHGSAEPGRAPSGDPDPTGPTGSRGDPERGGPEPAGAAPGESEPGAEGVSAARTGRQRLVAGLWPPRLSRSQLIVAVLLLGLGLGLTIQVRSTSEHSVLRGARQEDLVRILSELDHRTERLEEEKRTLENQRTELENSSDQAEEARRQTERRERQLGVLAGTLPARGPGITLTVTDSSGTVEADMLLDAIQELRAAGAEAIQINTVRVVAESYFADSDRGVRIDGRQVGSPYRFTAIGDPQDLEPALNIPGGVVQTLQRERATVSVERSEEVQVDAVRPAERPEHARSSSE